MTQLNRNDITNLYLYGQLSTPANLVDANLIRPKDAVSSVIVDVNDFMKTGAGRFAVGSQFELLQRFFALPLHVPPGTYTKLQVKDFFGLAFEEGFIGWNMQQFNYDDGANDYLDRVWVYNSMAFQISDDAVFIVEDNYEKRIENFAVHPRLTVPENFDFETRNPLTIVANAVVLPSIDPSGIGRKVNINFSDSSSVPRITYTKESFFNDFQTSQSWNVNTPAALARLVSTSGEFIDGLFNDGVTKFLDGNKPIVYGTVEDDLFLSAGKVNRQSYPNLYEFKKNGVVLIGGDGSDNIIGYSSNDKLLGGTGKDNLEGNGGADTLEGGSGNDTLNGGSGDQDIAVFSDKFENYKYTISDSGLFGLGGKIITFAHNKGTQADGTDTLQNIEFAKFSDRIVPLPLKDGPKNTTKSDIYDNNGQLFASASLTLPTFMFDGDADYTLNLSSTQGTQYNFAYIIDVSGSMSGSPLQQAKNAYISLTNSLISGGIADISRFAVIPFSDSASLNGPISPTQAISTIQGLSAGGGTVFSNALNRAYQFFSGLPKGGTNVVYFLSDGVSSGSFSSSASALQSIADVRAYGIGNNINFSQLNIVDSDDAVLLSNPSDLSSEFNNSGFSADDIAKIDIFVDGIVVETIQSDQLVDSALGLSFSASVKNLSVALDAQNKVTAEVFFTKGTPSAKVDFKVGTGETYIASLDGGNSAALAVNSLAAKKVFADVSSNSSPQNSTIASVNTDPFSKIAEGTSGNDLIILGAIDLGANAGAGNDKVVGNNLDNILNGGAGNDSLFGHEGDDRIITGDGNNLVDGGEGVDTVIYENRLSVDSHIQKTGKVITVDNKDTLLNVEFIQFSDKRISTENLLPVPILKGYDVTLLEGDSANKFAQFTLDLSFPAPVDIHFSYKTVDGTALAGSDYIARSGQVTIAAGEKSATIKVELIGDTEYEPDEIFALSLSKLSGATFENNEVEYTLIGNIENNVNNAPTLEKAIANQTATQNTTFSFTFAEDTFKDVDVDDSLSYSASLENGSLLPSWLTFDTATRTFNGTPSNTDVGNIDVKLVALDKTGATATAIFGLEVINVNDAPVATDDAAIILENQAVTISATKLLVNDKDIDGDILKISNVGNAISGSVAFNQNGDVVFTPADVNDASNISSLFNSETGDRTFSYTFTKSSIYKVGIGVVDIDDFTNTSALQIREASFIGVIQSVPEPSVALGSCLVIGFGIVFQGKRSKTSSNKRVSSYYK